MDTPQLAATDLDAALGTLAAPGVDVVLGPAADGGWWSIGFAGPAPVGVFDGIPTSRPDTGARQRTRLLDLGLRCVDLAEQVDVDTWREASLVADAHPSLRFSAAVRAVRAGTA